MPNVTIFLDQETLREARKYVHQQGITLDGLIQSLLAKTVTQNSAAWVEEFFALADQAKGNSRGKKWRREDLYDCLNFLG